MPNEFIGVCGPSGVGKRTLIQAIRDNKQNLRERFGIPADARIETFGASFGGLDDKHERAEYLLWKWQKNNNDFLEELPRRFPDSKHRLIVIWLPPEVHHHRMKNSDKSRHREEATRKGPERLARSFVRKYMPRFRDNRTLQQLGVSVELVDGSTSRYEETTWPDSE